MNIEQIKTDLSAGVIVSPATWRKLVEAALMMQEALNAVDMGIYPEGQPHVPVDECLKKVAAL